MLSSFGNNDIFLPSFAGEGGKRKKEKGKGE